MVAAGRASAPGTLILTVTRACDLRCAYCPTAKDGWPSLTPDDARAAVRLFATRYGGGDIKLFGGEPLLVPDVCRAAIDEAARHPGIGRVYLSTNGLSLDAGWLDLVRSRPDMILTISIDGAPEDHRRLRRALPGTPDAYDRILTLLPELLKTPRVVVTQTIAPATAVRAEANFRHLLDLGFTRFNLLPGYYIPWRPQQIEALRAGFDGIAAVIRERWAKDEPIYLRNLFTRAPTPFFNTGLVVDADRTIHPSNVGLSGALDGLRARTRAGTLDDPPTVEALASKSAEVNGLLEGALPPKVWESTRAVDAELTRMCRSLLRDWAARKKAPAEASA